MKRANHIRRLWRRFANDSRGTIAVITGLAFVPILICAGVAIDFARASREHQVFSAAVDSAALAVAASPMAKLSGLTSTQKQKQIAQLKDVARNYLRQNYQANIAGNGGMSINVNIGDDGVIRIKASHEFPTTLMSLVGFRDLDIGAEAEVRTNGAVNGVEIVMVMDTTGSMSGTKITDAKNAAKDLLNILYGTNSTNPNVRAALVPFSAGVNVGSQHRDSGWIDVNGLSSVNDWNFNTLAGWHNMRAWDELANVNWNGCVEARPGPLATNDTTPDLTIGPDTLFVPYFWPDEPNLSPGSGFSYINSYIASDTAETTGYTTQTQYNSHEWRQKNEKKYVNRTISTSNGKGPAMYCATAPIVPLTNTKSAVENGINAMSAFGSTVIPEGLAWGWRVLSPTQPFAEGSPYGDKFWKKVLILMTDGENDLLVSGTGNQPNTLNGTFYSAYGFGRQGRLGTTDPFQVNAALDARTTTVCNNIKAQGITIYTIAFQVNSTRIDNLLGGLNGCASDPEKYLKASTGAVLRQHFQAIGDQLRTMYLSK